MKAQRYDDKDPEGWTRAFPRENGRFVLYTDYATLEAQAERLREALEWAAGFAYSGGKRFADTEMFQKALSTLENDTPKEA